VSEFFTPQETAISGFVVLTKDFPYDFTAGFIPEMSKIVGILYIIPIMKMISIGYH